MAFVPAYKSRVLLGTLNLSCHLRNMSLSDMMAALDVTTLCNESRTFIPGETDLTFSGDGPLDVDASTGGAYDVLTSFKSATPLPLTVAPAGLAALGEVFLAHALMSTYTTSATRAGTVDFALATQNTGNAAVGVMLEDLTAITEDTTGTARDLTASSTAGGIAHLHVSAFSGLTSNDIIIEHSANGTTGWTTLVTFSQVTGIASERVEVAAGTTINRYLRVADNVDGTGSCTRAVAFARR